MTWPMDIHTYHGCLFVDIVSNYISNYKYIYISSRNGIPHHQDIWEVLFNMADMDRSARIALCPTPTLARNNMRLQRHRRLSENPRRRNSSDTTNSVPGWDMDRQAWRHGRRKWEFESGELTNVDIDVMFIYIGHLKSVFSKRGVLFSAQCLLDFTWEWEIYGADQTIKS